MNELIFGRDPTEGIVNITLKNDQIHIYTEDLDGKIHLEKFDYEPFVLSNRKISGHSEGLKGNQYWKYLTSVSCDKFNELQQKFQRDLWLPRSLEETFTLVHGSTYFKNRKVEDVSILSFDIETSGLVMNETSRVFLITNTFRKNGVITKKTFSLEDYEGDGFMIAAWCDWVREVNPSIMCGHNIFSYDLPYLDRVLAERSGGHGELLLGRDDTPIQFEEKTSKFRKDGSQQYDYHNARITGREIIDTFFLSIKYDIGRTFPSYGLKPIIRHLKMEKPDRTFVDASKIAQYFDNRQNDPDMWNNVKMYASDDSDDALKLYDIMIPAYFYLCQSVPLTFQQVINTATGSQINSFLVRSYLQHGGSVARADIIRDHLEGGISFGIPGLYKNMMKIDLKSAYPSQVLRFKLYDPRKDPNAYFYEMVKYFTLERFELKKQYKETNDRYYLDREKSSKIFINSAYGACSTNYLNYNSPKLAAKITEATREIIDMSLLWASNQGKDYWIDLFKEKTGQLDET